MQEGREGDWVEGAVEKKMTKTTQQHHRYESDLPEGVFSTLHDGVDAPKKAKKARDEVEASQDEMRYFGGHMPWWGEG